MMRYMLCGGAMLLAVPAAAQDKSLARHDFLYCGEYQRQSLDGQQAHIVRGGKIVWTYTNPKHGEISECHLLPNGNMLIARHFGASEIRPDKSVAWDYDSPPDTELHAIYPMSGGRVALIENGHPARFKIIRKSDNAQVGGFILDTDPKQGIHIQFRRFRPLANGHWLVAHFLQGKVVEYTADGKAVWSVASPMAWGAVRLKNGNTLISGDNIGYVREVDKGGKIVWEVKKNELPGINFNIVQEVSRLANGNTLINNWVANTKPETWPGTTQVVEVTPDKKVVWQLSDWGPGSLGPATNTQLLDKKAGQVR